MSKKLTLKYKAKNIARAERQEGKKFFEVFNELGQGAPSFSSLLFLLMAGGATEEEAGDFVDEVGIGEALILAVESLSRSGFLGKTKINTAAMRKEMEQSLAEASQTSGSSKKA